MTLLDLTRKITCKHLKFNHFMFIRFRHREADILTACVVCCRTPLLATAIQEELETGCAAPGDACNATTTVRRHLYSDDFILVPKIMLIMIYVCKHLSFVHVFRQRSISLLWSRCCVDSLGSSRMLCWTLSSVLQTRSLA